MRPFESLFTVATPLHRANVDTDQIIPKQFLKLVQRSGFGRYLFYDWRFGLDGNPDQGFVLNDPRYAESRILLTGENFGCGSSREHAVWALYDYGFRAVIAPSFADIFYGNCFKNGLLPVRLEPAQVAELYGMDCPIRVDLDAQRVSAGSRIFTFEIDSYKKRMLLEGLDEIALTLQLEDLISRYERDADVPSLV